MRLALDLSLPADGSLLASTRKVLSVYLREFGTPNCVVDDVILAMDEACANVLQHAYPDDDGGHYRLRADLERERVLIEVVDEGIGFDVMAKRPPPRDEDAHMIDSGRGLEVMRRLMTTVEVESPTPAGGTRLRLTRVLPAVGD
ncbi:MAG TPA: ATP-binding protein [Acidimicrobiales bacterium]|jgi:anti-sigma regulatory factor (Ser/Thr protein kinase)|nr:ATP-binding protein [Acidimicrobiales bacterium]